MDHYWKADMKGPFIPGLRYVNLTSIEGLHDELYLSTRENEVLKSFFFFARRRLMINVHDN